MGIVVSIVSQKGGVGKSTTAINLSASLAAAEKKVLLVDLDPQGNTTSGLGIDKKGFSQSIYHCLIENVPAGKVLLDTVLPHLKVLPSRMELFRSEIELMSHSSKETVLKQRLSSIREEYDYVIVDSPPSMGLLTFNAITAADLLLIPLQCEYPSLEAISQAMHVIQVVKRRLCPQLPPPGILLTMVDPKDEICQQVSRNIREQFGPMVFKTVIPRDPVLRKGLALGKPALLVHMQSPGARSYLDLAGELMAMPSDRNTYKTIFEGGS